STLIMLRAPAPKPPCASGSGSAIRPSSASAAQNLGSKPVSDLVMALRVSKSYALSIRRLTLSASSCSSSLSVKSMVSCPPSEPEGHLGNDIALDLVRAGVDAGLAIVEIARGGGRDEIIETVVVQGAKGASLRAQGLQQELGDRLLVVGAAHFQQGHHRADLAGAHDLVDELHAGDLERHQFDLDARQLVGETRVFDQ